MRIPKLALIAFALLSSVPATSQDVSSAGHVSESIEVRVINVEVMVSDRRGRPVAGLGPADFEVLVDGEAVEVVNFFADEVRPAAPLVLGASPAEASRRPLQLAILVDSSNVEVRARNKALERVAAFLRTELGPEDRLMLVSVPPVRDLMAAAPDAFTRRLDLVVQGLDEIAATPAQDRRQVEFQEILQDIGTSLAASNASVQGRMRSLEARIRAFSAEASRDTARTASGLRRLVRRFTGLPGRKAILYLGSGLSLRPGEALSGALDQALGRYVSQLPQGTPIPDLPGRSSDDDSGELRDLARYASVRGVALYSVSLGESTPTAALTLSHGLAEAGAGSAPGQEDSWAPMVGVSRQFDLESSLQLLAGATGGLSSAGRGLGRLLDRLRDDVRTFYSLGIRPPEDAPATEHRLEVKVRGRGREVRHRETFRTAGGDEEARSEIEPLTAPIEATAETTRLTTRPESPPVEADRAEPEPIQRRKKGRRYRLPEAEIARAYRKALSLLAGGEAEIAHQALRELEAGAARRAVYDQLEKIESQVLLRLTKESPNALLPVAVLHADLILIYRSEAHAPLAEHARRMSIRLARSIAGQGSSDGVRAAAGALLIELAGSLLRAGRLGEAQQLFEIALEADEGNAVACLGLGVSHEWRGQYEEAVQALEPLAERVDQAEAQLRLALNLERLGRSARSRPLLESLIVATPDWVALIAIQETARIALAEERYDQASKVLGQALKRWPDHHGLRIQEAYLSDRDGAPRRAREQVVSLISTADSASSPRDRYNRWPASETARRELREDVGVWLDELGAALERIAR